MVRIILTLIALCSAIAAPSRAQSPLLLRPVATGGAVRWFRVHVPQNYVPGVPTPVVLGFHGGGGNATGFAIDTGLPATADANGFLAVFPEGTPATGVPFWLETWNAGNCCGAAAAGNVDDVQFVRDLLDAVASEWTVDPARIHATGLSNGGMLAYRLGVEMADRLASIAPVAAALGVTTVPTRPIPVMAFHGALDTNVPWQGGVGTGVSGTAYASQTASIAPFLGVNQATLPTAPSRVVGQALLFETPTPATGAPVAYWWLVDQGHSWPGRPSQVMPNEPYNTDIDPNAEMWSFFVAHPRLAAVVDLGGGCGSAVLSVSAPILGQPVTAVVNGAPAQVAGSLFLGAPASGPINVSPTCTTWIVPASAASVASFSTNPLGRFQMTTLLPADPALHGTTHALQALVTGPTGPVVSNAVHLTLAF